MENVVLILSDARGIFIPRDFLTDNYNEIAVDHCTAWGLTEENREHWQAAVDPESEYYWEAWDWVLSNAEYRHVDGRVFRLHQDGDLWGICYEHMTCEEKQNFGFEE